MKIKLFLLFFISLFTYLYLTLNNTTYAIELNASQKVCITAGTFRPPNQGTLSWTNISNPPTNPAYTYISLDSWNSLSLEQKFYTKPVWTYVISANCSYLNVTYNSSSQVTTTTVPLTTVVSTTFLTTTTLSSPTTTILNTVQPTYSTITFATTTSLLENSSTSLLENSSQEQQSNTTPLPKNSNPNQQKTTNTTTTSFFNTTTTIATTTTVLESSDSTTPLTSILDANMPDQNSRYDPKLVMLYAFIASLVYLLVNNSIKYMQIYKYGHKTWPQRIWEFVFK